VEYQLGFSVMKSNRKAQGAANKAEIVYTCLCPL
jgi:hypothetical protein